jgi:cell division septal protein FtsQ
MGERRNQRARRFRNIALALVLFALVILFYVMTFLRVHP